MIDFTNVSKRDLPKKDLGRLISEMVLLIIQEPRVVDDDFAGPLRDTYLVYCSEIKMREYRYKD